MLSLLEDKSLSSSTSLPPYLVGAAPTEEVSTYVRVPATGPALLCLFVFITYIFHAVLDSHVRASLQDQSVYSIHLR